MLIEQRPRNNFRQNFQRLMLAMRSSDHRLKHAKRRLPARHRISHWFTATIVFFNWSHEINSKKAAQQAVQADPNKRPVFGLRRIPASLIVCRHSRRLSGPLNRVVRQSSVAFVGEECFSRRHGAHGGKRIVFFRPPAECDVSWTSACRSFFVNSVSPCAKLSGSM